ncbi:MAG: hypothetical protein ACI9DC_005389 [Gammaproteobacteria bacterium]|jgi:hypothetical protein
MRHTGLPGKPTDTTTPASITLPGVENPIESLAALEKVLKRRTTVPTQRYARFLELDDETLASAGGTTRYAAEHLERLLQDLRGRTTRVDAVLSGMDTNFFTLDHQWRGIFKALIDAGSTATQYQLVAIANYRRFLLHCLDTLNQISTDRLQSALCGESDSNGEERTQLAATSRTGYDSSRKSEEVLIRDLVRLPRGTTLPLRQGREGPFEIWLGKRRFRIESWAGVSLVDEQGHGAGLRDGRNVVGRALYNDVIVDAHFRDVSRRHLILDLDDGSPCAITDLSTAGTYVSRALVNVAA